MKVLLTGASGFIGSAVAERLRSRGDIVVPVTRRPAAIGEVGLDLQGGRLDASRLPGGTLEGIDASIHLAGAPIIARWTPRRVAQIRSSRITAGDLVARSLAILERRPSVHITGSAVGYYGDRGEEVLDEASPPGNGFLPDVCNAWEAAATPAKEAGIRTVAIRTGVVLGRKGALGTQLPLFKLGLGGRLGSGRQWLSWISLEDEVSAILRALDDPTISGPVNATAPNPVRNSEFTTILARVLHRPAVLPVPAAALKAVLGAGPAEEMLLASQRVMPRRLETTSFQFRHETVEGAIRAAVR